MIGPFNDRQAKIWTVLEPHLDTFIHLDLNDYKECQTFSNLVVEIDEAL